MNEMIGEKTAESRSRSLQHYQPGTEGKKVSLHREHTPRAIPFMLLTIASRQMFTAAHVRAPGDRRGDGVFAVMSLGNWTAQEPQDPVKGYKGIIIGEVHREYAWFGNDANKYTNVQKCKIYHSKPLRGNLRRERPRVIHSESNLGSQLLPPPPPRPTCHMFHSSFSSPPSQGSSSPNPRPRMGFRRGSSARPSPTSPDANHLASIQTRKLSPSLPCVLRRVCGLVGKATEEDSRSGRNGKNGFDGDWRQMWSELGRRTCHLDR